MNIAEIELQLAGLVKEPFDPAEFAFRQWRPLCGRTEVPFFNKRAKRMLIEAAEPPVVQRTRPYSRYAPFTTGWLVSIVRL